MRYLRWVNKTKNSICITYIDDSKENPYPITYLRYNGGKQLGWRLKDAETMLFLPLFRLGYQMKTHLTAYG